MEAQHTSVGGPVYVFTLGAIPDELTAIWNVPWRERERERENRKKSHTQIDR